MQVLEFIFQDFWHFIGAMVLLSLIARCIALFKPINIEKHYHNKDSK